MCKVASPLIRRRTHHPLALFDWLAGTDDKGRFGGDVLAHSIGRQPTLGSVIINPNADSDDPVLLLVRISERKGIFCTPYAILSHLSALTTAAEM